MEETEIDYQDDDSHDWEYAEEAIQEYQRRESQARFDRQPEICKRCRWLDWYYVEGCTHGKLPDRKPGKWKWKCAYYARDLRLNWLYQHSRRLWLLVLTAQYRWWQVRTFWDWRKSYTRPFSAPIGGYWEEGEEWQV